MLQSLVIVVIGLGMLHQVLSHVLETRLQLSDPIENVRAVWGLLDLMSVTVNLRLQRFAILSNDTKDTSGERGSYNTRPSAPWICGILTA